MAFIILIGFIALIALPSVIWLYALADVIRNDFKHISTKIVWVINLCFIPPLGTILYFLIGRNQRITYHPVGKLVVFCMFIIPVLMIVAYFLFLLGHLPYLPEPPETIRI
jgi:Ni,Fe-hydrogenase I cytochrome b subunit